MTEPEASPPLPDPWTVAPSALIQEIVDLDASDTRHPQWARHDALANLIHPMIWAWAKREPDEARRLGLALGAAPPGFQPKNDLYHRVAGHALLAAAFHGGAWPPIPFMASTSLGAQRDDFGDPQPIVLADPQWIDGADSPWADIEFGRHAFWSFHEIAKATLTGHDPSRPVLSANEILARHEARLASRLDCVKRPYLKPKEWIEFASAVAAASERSTLDAVAAQATGSQSKARSL